MTTKTEIVLAIDPGREKCGLAVVTRTGGVLHQSVVASARVIQTIQGLRAKHGIEVIALGDSTSSKQWQALLHQTLPDLSLCVVDETGSTLEARGRYWRAHPPGGWRRLVPLSLQVPPEPVDDFAAVVLALRYYQQNGDFGLP